MRIAFIRGAFLNNFELANYKYLNKNQRITLFSSLYPLDRKFPFECQKLLSPTDLPEFPGKFSLLNRIFGDVHKLFGLEKQLTGFDIGHYAENYYYYTYQALIAKHKDLKKKVVSTIWENITYNNEGIPFRKKIKKLAYRDVDKFLCVSGQAKKALIKEGVNPEKIEVVYPGVDPERFSYQIPRKTFKNVVNLLFVGRLVKEKGIYDLFEAFKNIINKHKNININLTLVGQGKGKNNLLDKVKNWVKGGGYIIASVPYLKTLENYPEHYRDYSEEDLKCLFKDIGNPEIIRKDNSWVIVFKKE